MKSLFCGCSSSVERELPKLNRWVRLPSAAPKASVAFCYRCFFLFGSRTKPVEAFRKPFGEWFLASSGETGTEMRSIWVGEPVVCKAKPQQTVDSHQPLQKHLWHFATDAFFCLGVEPSRSSTREIFTLFLLLFLFTRKVYFYRYSTFIRHLCLLVAYAFFAFGTVRKAFLFSYKFF